MSGTGQSAAGMPGVVVVAASYGGLSACKALLPALPRDFPVPILLAQHRHPDADYVAPILSRIVELPVAVPRDGEELRPGTLFVLPAASQVAFDDAKRLRLTPSTRCFADPLLESAAFAFGDGVIAVILTGRLNDGAAGVRAVKRRGGRVIAQDEQTSEAFGMPGAAIGTGCVDFVLPLPALVALTMVPGAAELFRVRLAPWAAVA